MAPSIVNQAVNCPPFDPQVESISEFVERFKIFNSESLAKAGANEQKKAAIFIKCLPVDVITNLQRRMKPIKLSEATYDDILKKITSQFLVKKSLVGAAVQFLNRKQQSSETIEVFAKIINDLADACEYSDCCRDRLLRDTFISGLQSSAIMKSLLPKADNLTFNECIERAKFLEQVTFDAEDMQSVTSYKLNSQPRYEKQNTFTVPSSYICIRCSAAGKHIASKCPCINLICKQCQKKGHIAKACRTSKLPAHTVQEREKCNATNMQPTNGCAYGVSSLNSGQGVGGDFDRITPCSSEKTTHQCSHELTCDFLM